MNGGRPCSQYKKSKKYEKEREGRYNGTARFIAQLQSRHCQSMRSGIAVSHSTSNYMLGVVSDAGRKGRKSDP